jgi:hypothetical protein
MKDDIIPSAESLAEDDLVPAEEWDTYQKRFRWCKRSNQTSSSSSIKINTSEKHFMSGLNIVC